MPLRREIARGPDLARPFAVPFFLARRKLRAINIGGARAAVRVVRCVRSASVGGAPNADRGRRDQCLVSGSVVWAARADLKLSAEVGAASKPEPQRATWPVVARLGLIATVTPSLDVDVGYQTRLNRAAPEQMIVAGAPLRW